MNKAVKWTLISLPVLVGGYFIYTQVKRYSASKAPGAALPPAGGGGTGTTPVSACSFPLKKGSVGVCVQQLQMALIKYYGPSILPKYGADGNWGAETEGAVKALTGTSGAQSFADQNSLNSTLEYLNA